MSIILNFRSKFPEDSKKQVINADLIPSISENVFQKKILIQKKIIPPQIIPVKKEIVQARPELKVMPVPPNYVPQTGEFGKISFLLKDPSVTSIECSGVDKIISVMRAGQKQETRISLSSNELQSILNTIAEKARIPLMEGVFKAAVDNFIIDAVISPSIGSRFFIKKQTPYSILEPRKY